MGMFPQCFGKMSIFATIFAYGTFSEHIHATLNSILLLHVLGILAGKLFRDKFSLCP